MFIVNNFSRKKKESSANFIFSLAIFFLLFLKCLNMYSILNVGEHFAALSFATCAIVAIIYFAVLIFNTKAANIVLFVVYFITSVIMCVDLVYFNYMGRLPSFALLQMAWQLEGVTDSVISLISLRQLIPLLDFPVWLIIAVIRKPLISKIKIPDISKLATRLLSFGFIVLFVLCGGYFLIFRSFEIDYLSSELYLYHINDFHNTFFTTNEGEVDKRLYTVHTDENNPYYGIARDRNVFVIQVEALQDFMFGKEFRGTVLTPTMNALIENDSFYFENYYYQIGGGNTCDAEFTVNNSLFAPENEPGYKKYVSNDFYGLPWILKDNGYSGAYAFHAYEGNFWNREMAYPYQGFDNYTSLEDFNAGDDPYPLGISDRSFFNQSLEIIKGYEEPFYSFFVTLSTHHPYSVLGKDRAFEVSDDERNLAVLYFQAVNYFDRVLGEFFEKLDEAGLYENSIFVIYGDHYGLSSADDEIRGEIEAVTGETYSMFERFSVPLIIHIPGMGQAQTLDVAGGHIDVLPTLLCLLGLENDKAVMFGHNLLDPDYEGIVYEQTHLLAGSFITKDVMYVNTENGIASKIYYISPEVSAKLEGVGETQYTVQSEDALKAIRDCSILLDANDIWLD